MITDLLRLLPSVDEVLRDSKLVEELEGQPRSVVVQAVRDVLDTERRRLLAGAGLNDENKGKAFFLERTVLKTLEGVRQSTRSKLRPVINATGVVLHTNLGRALLSERARQAVNGVASCYSNLELDLDTGRRGSRYAPLELLLGTLTGAEAALVVNNNAAAVLLALSTLARDREVIVSRGQLVEIGGSFRVPEVMAQSGAHLVEVGATNKTYPDDFRKAIGQNTALLLHVHTSNYRIVGFTRETTIAELVEIGKLHSLPVMSDLGSGFLFNLSGCGLPPEPTVKQVVGAGPDVVTFSGDKLLGGPQAGIIVGRKDLIEQMKNNPLTRAVRIDKMTVAALEATLREYHDQEQAIREIPTLRMLTLPLETLQQKGSRLAELLRKAAGEKAEIGVEKGFSAVGGGSLPTAELPSVLVAVCPAEQTAGEIQTRLRQGDPAVMGRVQEEKLLLDVRTLGDDELEPLAGAVAAVLGRGKE